MSAVLSTAIRGRAAILLSAALGLAAAVPLLQATAEAQGLIATRNFPATSGKAGERLSVSVSGRTVVFTLSQDGGFTYVVTSPMAEGRYTFSGVVRDQSGHEHPVGERGHIQVTPPTSAEPTGRRQPPLRHLCLLLPRRCRPLGRRPPLRRRRSRPCRPVGRWWRPLREHAGAPGAFWLDGRPSRLGGYGRLGRAGVAVRDGIEGDLRGGPPPPPGALEGSRW